MSSNDPIPRVKRSYQVQSRLLSVIWANDPGPGDPLSSERELMEVYSVGWSAIREAIQNL
ncbi:MAG: GntR family transcriptional regulator [Cypionkella sp.]